MNNDEAKTIELDGGEVTENIASPKPPLYFFTVTEDKQQPILFECLPLLKPFFEEFQRIMKAQEGGEKAKALIFAQQELSSAEALLMSKNDTLVYQEARSKTPGTGALVEKHGALGKAMEERAQAQERVMLARINAGKAMQEAKSEESEIAISLLWEVVENTVNIHYENAIKIVAAFSNVTRAQLSQEKGILQIIPILFEIVGHEDVLAVFLQWQELRSKMQSAFSRK